MIEFFKNLYKKMKSAANQDITREKYKELINIFRRVTPLELGDLHKIEEIACSLCLHPELASKKFALVREAVRTKGAIKPRYNLFIQNEYDRLSKRKVNMDRDVSYYVNGQVVYGEVESSEEAEYFKRDNVDALNCQPISGNKCDFGCINNECKSCIESRLRKEIGRQYELENTIERDEKVKKRKMAKNRMVVTDMNEKLGCPSIIGRYLSDDQFSIEDLESEEREEFLAWKENNKRLAEEMRKNGASNYKNIFKSGESNSILNEKQEPLNQQNPPINDFKQAFMNSYNSKPLPSTENSAKQFTNSFSTANPVKAQLDDDNDFFITGNADEQDGSGESTSSEDKKDAKTSPNSHSEYVTIKSNTDGVECVGEKSLGSGFIFNSQKTPQFGSTNPVTTINGLQHQNTMFNLKESFLKNPFETELSAKKNQESTNTHNTNSEIKTEVKELDIAKEVSNSGILKGAENDSKKIDDKSVFNVVKPVFSGFPSINNKPNLFGGINTNDSENKPQNLFSKPSGLSTNQSYSNIFGQVDSTQNMFPTPLKVEHDKSSLNDSKEKGFLSNTLGNSASTLETQSNQFLASNKVVNNTLANPFSVSDNTKTGKEQQFSLSNNNSGHQLESSIANGNPPNSIFKPSVPTGGSFGGISIQPNINNPVNSALQSQPSFNQQFGTSSLPKTDQNTLFNPLQQPKSIFDLKNSFLNSTPGTMQNSSTNTNNIFQAPQSVAEGFTSNQQSFNPNFPQNNMFGSDTNTTFSQNQNAFAQSFLPSKRTHDIISSSKSIQPPTAQPTSIQPTVPLPFNFSQVNIFQTARSSDNKSDGNDEDLNVFANNDDNDDGGNNRRRARRRL